MNKAIFFLSLSLLLLTLSCGGGGSSSGGGSSGYDLTTVSYKIEPTGVTCLDQNKSDDFVIQGNGMDIASKSCTWYCANYKDYTRKYVVVTFTKPTNSDWAYDFEMVMPGNCN